MSVFEIAIAVFLGVFVLPTVIVYTFAFIFVIFDFIATSWDRLIDWIYERISKAWRNK